MKPPRLGIIILILGLVALGTYLLTNIPKTQTAKNFVSYSSVKLSSPAPEVSSFGNFDEKTNLTKNLGDTLYQQIQQTENFSTDIDSLSEELANKIINNSLSDFQLVSTIDDSDLKISQDVSREAKIQYLKAIGEISQKNYSGFSKNYLEVIIDTYQKLDYSSADRLANIYKNLSADYLNISVPADWVDFHKQLILYTKNAAIVYRVVANYLTDSLKGGLLFSETEIIETLVNSAGNIQNIFSEKIKEVDS